MTDPHSDLVCRELVELVTEYLSEALSADDRARFEHHLSECPPCTTYPRTNARDDRACRHVARTE